jgi:hypothetical protein
MSQRNFLYLALGCLLLRVFMRPHNNEADLLARLRLAGY